MSSDYVRISKELAECAKDTKSGVQCVPVNGSMVNLEGRIKGPEGTPFEGGNFKIEIKITNGYPFEPPKMKFLTKIWHPNISSQTGAICLDILKDQWSPALTIKTALMSLQALMCSPEPDDPQDAEVAKMYKTSYPTFQQTARFWTETYAMKSESEDSHEKMIERICEMGFDPRQAQRALEANGWDEVSAINSLLTG
mmetsp:Transcript_11854/g.17674  ORF Transcript_11854/g.17674 Transcript_11854/m.17674 type:complete len:197 (+) Transcript_11854:67-657(+)